ncbi:FecR family protein [Rhodoferax aquaticus]|nr:FecR domain-containing protein [Rhodoferax aquaticus]
MPHSTFKPYSVVSCLVLALMGWGGAVGVAHAARVVAVHGVLHLERGDKAQTVLAGMAVQEGDSFRSEGEAELLIRFDDGARMVLRPGSNLRLTTLREHGPMTKRQKTMHMVKGGLRFVSGRGPARHRVAFETETATIGIRGTDIEIAVADEAVADNASGTYLQVNSGAATLQAVDGTVLSVDPGEVAFGGEPELTPKDGSGIKRPAGRKLLGAMLFFKKTGMDAMLK